MVEMRRRRDGFGADIAGDAFNTAAHLADLGRDVVHVQDLANDVFAEQFAAAFNARNVRRLGRLLPHGTNGLYIVVTGETGEHHFQYHRAGSAAGGTLLGRVGAIRKAMESAELIYLTGVTLSTCSAPRELIDLLATSSTPIAVGLNIRSGLHRRVDDAILPVDRDDELGLLRAAIDHATVVFGSAEELELLGEPLVGGTARPDERPLVIATSGPEGVRSFGLGADERWVPPKAISITDASGAGDALAAGFLDAWLSGHTVRDCLAAGGQRSLLALAHAGALPPPTQAPQG